MNKRTVATLAITVVLLIAAIIVCSWPSGEPVYKGKRVREYLYDLGAGEGPSFYLDAFAEFGANAVPYVLAAFQVKDTWDRRILVHLAVKMPWLKIRVLSADEMHHAAMLAYVSMIGAAKEGKMSFSVSEQCESGPRGLLQDVYGAEMTDAKFALWRVEVLRHFPFRPPSGLESLPQ
jgi:hypothetical protein